MSAWSNWVGKFCFIAALAVPMALSGASLPVSAQDQQDQQQPQQQSLTQQELAQLVAPIALYPDALLAQVLTASTYPLEVAMAARWSEKNPDLKGAALEDAMQKEPWDPSVKGLTSVPQVLAMMNDKLDWTQQLGEAFLAQPDDIQNAVQALRARADEAGNLKSSKEQRVRRVAAPPSTGYVGPPEYIVIEPVEPDYVYVPVYDPVVVYGADYWPPAYVPFFWYPRWWTVGPVIGFGAAAFVGPALWYHYNWGNRGYAAVQTNTALYSRFNRVNVTGGGQFQNWRFDAAHRANVPFKNTNLQRQFGNVGTRGVQGVQTGQGQIEQQRQQQQQQQRQQQQQQQPAAATTARNASSSSNVSSSSNSSSNSSNARNASSSNISNSNSSSSSSSSSSSNSSNSSNARTPAAATAATAASSSNSSSSNSSNAARSNASSSTQQQQQQQAAAAAAATQQQQQTPTAATAAAGTSAAVAATSAARETAALRRPTAASLPTVISYFCLTRFVQCSAGPWVFVATDQGCDVRYWHIADIDLCAAHVCF